MNRTERRKAQRQRQAELQAAGVYVPRPRKTHFTRPQIAETMRAEMKDAPRVPKRLVVEPNWHVRSAEPGHPPVTVYELGSK